MKWFFACSLFILYSCSNNLNCKGGIHVVVKDLKGFDGCGKVLQLDDGSYLEPQNINDFNIDYLVGDDYHVTYKEVSGASVCMVGKIVEIKCLSEDL